MHPISNQERRRARAQALHKQDYSNPQVGYMNAAEHPEREAMAAVVVDSSHRTLAALSFTTQFPTVGEEMGFAHAIISSPKVTTLISDSKWAITNYSSRRVDP
ncbi:hypothetical protein HPB48_018600 [Haemaphysalis longicornis]|uniref:Uncharacterized protein n=1 Tax=Haemaphysalis longicornis TaxID=44386 RepID=A0A9J6FQU7_HAELO|nr:hypothetical protein HPB48_018600 [Haemaphysalis longicornis]